MSTACWRCGYRFSPGRPLGSLAADPTGGPRPKRKRRSSGSRFLQPLPRGRGPELTCPGCGARVPFPEFDPGRALTSAADVHRASLDLVALTQEVYVAYLLDTKNFPRRRVTIATGSLTGVLVHPREVFRQAVLEPANAVIFVHNHPSGDPKPSPEDVALTRRLVAAGDILGIAVLDHVIVGGNAYYSFAEARRLR